VFIERTFFVSSVNSLIDLTDFSPTLMTFQPGFMPERADWLSG
jgi:hypothetical protein